VGITYVGDAAEAQAPRQFQFSNGELGSGDFLRLMIEELVNQDPLNPVKNEELLAQVSSIKNMETLSRLDKTMGEFTVRQQVTGAGYLIGREVTGVSTANENVTGVVARVRVTTQDDVTTVKLVTTEGVEINLSNVIEIREVSEK
jgi:flagellar basal-body rod modification protein FlgD